MEIIERRSSERLSLKLPVLVSMVDEKGKEESLELTTKDISSGGAYFHTDYPFEEGMDLKMDIMLSLLKDRKRKSKKVVRIDISGNVIRTENNGMAVSFDKRYKISPFEA